MTRDPLKFRRDIIETAWRELNAEAKPMTVGALSIACRTSLVRMEDAVNSMIDDEKVRLLDASEKRKLGFPDETVLVTLVGRPSLKVANPEKIA